MKTGPCWLFVPALVSFAFLPTTIGGGELATTTPSKTTLRIHPTNPRYFTDGTETTDGTLKAVYLTGSHTWASLQDIGVTNPPPAFDFTAYLDFLERHHHNFIRLW